MGAGICFAFPEKMSNTGRRVSLSFDPEDGRVIGGPTTTDGLIVEIANDGYQICQSFILTE
jgi:hypothetical protein